MSNVECPLKIKNSNSKRKDVNKNPIHKYNSAKKLKFYHNKKAQSSKTNNLLTIHCFGAFESSFRTRESKSNNQSTNKKYKKELFKKFYVFLKKKKFKISKKFNEKNAKKFLETKDKCLQRIILSDIIEEEDNNLHYKKKYETQKNLNNYKIIITNYDEEIKNKEKQNMLNKTKTHIN